MELWAFLKQQNIVSTGGQAKVYIRSRKVLLNGVVETQKKKKLASGDIVACEGKEYVVK